MILFRVWRVFLQDESELLRMFLRKWSVSYVYAASEMVYSEARVLSALIDDDLSLPSDLSRDWFQRRYNELFLEDV